MRKIRGLTQEQLGERAGMDYKYLGGIERGERNPSADNLAKIAVGLQVKIHEIFLFEPDAEDIALVKDRIDQLLDVADKKDLKTIWRIIEAILMR